MSSDEFKAKCARTREIFLEGGIDISEWAISRGFKPETVSSLLDGRSRGLRGMSRAIAETLGLVHPRPKAASIKYAKTNAARAALRASIVKTPLEVSWRRVGDAIDRLTAQGMTPAQWGEANGISWWSLKPVFVDLRTPQQGGAMRACRMLDLLGPPEMAQHLYPKGRAKRPSTKKPKAVRAKPVRVKPAREKPVREIRLEISQRRLKELLDRLKNERVGVGEYAQLHGLDGNSLLLIIKSRVKGASGRPRAVAEELDLLGTFEPTHDHPPAPAWYRRAQMNAKRAARRQKVLPAAPSTQISWEKLDAVRMRLCAQGVTAEEWAKKNNFPPVAVETVLVGLDRGEVGFTRQVAAQMGVLGEPYFEQHLHPKSPKRHPRRPVQISLSRLDMMRALMAEAGTTPFTWAKKFGFKLSVVEAVLKGEDPCVGGEARKVAAMMYILGDPYIEQHVYPKPPAPPRGRKPGTAVKPPKDQSPQWAYKLKEWLATDAAPEVIHQLDLVKVCFEIKQQLVGASDLGVKFADRWIRQMISERALKRSQAYLFNRMVSRHPAGFDMARRLKPGAVISLWTVLIRNDLLDGLVDADIACVVAPKSDHEMRPQVEIAIPKLPPFVFREVDHLSPSSQVVLPADSLDERFSYPVATSERAFLEWMALKNRKGPGWVPAIPSKIKYEGFDLTRLHHLAELMGLSRDLDLWVAWRKSMKTRPPQPVVRPPSIALKAVDDPLRTQVPPKPARASPESVSTPPSPPEPKRRGRPPKGAPSFESILFSQMRAPVSDPSPETQPSTIRVRRSRDISTGLPNDDQKAPAPARQHLSWKRVGAAIDKMAAQGTTPRRWASVNGYQWWLIRPVFEEALVPGSAVARKLVAALDLLGAPEMEQHVYPRPREQSDAGYEWRWPAALQRWLESDAAPESLTRKEIHEMAWSTCLELDGGRSPLDQTIIDWIHQNVARGVFQHIGSAYVNTQVRKRSNGFSIAANLYPGSVVSLWTVLIENGLMDGSHENIASVGAPRRSTVKSESRVTMVEGYLPFQFHELEGSMFQSDRGSSDSFDTRFTFPVATPERALMDWLALRRRSGPTWVPIPPLKLSLELMNSGRLDRLASAMDLVDDFRQWRERHINVARRARGSQSEQSLTAVSSGEGSQAPDWEKNAWPN